MSTPSSATERRKQAAEEVANQLWAAHVADPTDETLEALVVHYEPLARYLARRALAKAPAYQDREDILSYAHHGLLDALRRFEPGRVKFETYATRRIAGAIIDGQRRNDPLTRSARKRVKEMTAATRGLEERLEREPTVAEIAAEMGITEADVRELVITQMSVNASLDDLLERHEPGSATLAGFAADGEVDMPMRLQEIRDALAGRLPKLSERERAFVILHYCQYKTIREAAEKLHVHESRAAQIRREIMHTLRAT